MGMDVFGLEPRKKKVNTLEIMFGGGVRFGLRCSH